MLYNSFYRKEKFIFNMKLKTTLEILKQEGQPILFNKKKSKKIKK